MKKHLFQKHKEINLDLKKLVTPKYFPVFKDVIEHKHTHYVLPGGRGSTKSSLFGLLIPLLIVMNNNVHAVVFRKVGNTVQKSTRSQVEWGIYQLGLEDYFDIPKTYSNPIVYRPTGQQIIFMGLDDPRKVKSIKLPFGYIGITWWEELDQYAGENEVRNVLQSTMRGGDKFWDFRSFNPPISKNNWANEYADIAELRANTLVVRSSYLDVPREWLGEQFFEEAEDLKAINPRAYEHEYLGIPIGTGGDVFPNVEDLDMEQLIDIPTVDDSGHSTTKKIKLMDTFGTTLFGLDFGFSVDPNAFTKCYFDSKKLDLYIFDEYQSVRMRNEELYRVLYKEKKLISNEDMLTADSAEPKSIADLRAYGAFIRGAEKGPESVRYSIKWLQSLNHIYIDKRRCPKTYKEFIEYEYERDRDGNFISAYPDFNNHCLVGETLVKTSKGEIPIKDLVGKEGKLFAYDIENGKIVETKFENCRVTFEEAEVIELELLNGVKVKCTGDHLILTHNRGYVQAKDLTTEDDVVFIDTV